MHMICTEKFDSEGVLELLKARGVINGSRQGEVNGNDAYTLRSESARIIAAFAAQHGLLLKQLDFKTAFLNTIIKNRNIFVRVPDALLKFLGTSKHYARLHKTVYGLKQASAEWYEHISKWLIKHGFTPLKSDPCVFKAPPQLGTNTIIGISTDDILVAIDTDEHYNDLCVLLNSEHVVKDLGAVKWYLGIAYSQDLVNMTVKLSQTHYITELAIQHGVHESKPVRTVLPDKLPTIKEIATTPEQLKSSAQRPYRQLLGSINFVAANTRPDIAMAVSYLSTFGRSHGEAHWHALRHLLAYLYHSRHLELTYTHQPDESANIMRVYTDSGYDSCDPLCLSGQYAGYVALLNGAAVSWKSRRVDVKLSTAEVEYVALCLGGRQASHGKQFLQEVLGHQQLAPVVIYCDNKAAVSIAKSDSVTQLNKHFDIKYHWIRDKIKTKWFDVCHIDTKSQPADILTKNLPAQDVKTHRSTVLGAALA
jgi:hypothetical protein